MPAFFVVGDDYNPNIARKILTYLNKVGKHIGLYNGVFPSILAMERYMSSHSTFRTRRGSSGQHEISLEPKPKSFGTCLGRFDPVANAGLKTDG